MRCPHCGARVSGKRLDCPRCGNWLDEAPARGEAGALPVNKPLLIAMIVLLAALLVVTFLAFTGKLGKHDPDPVPVAAVTAAAETAEPVSTPAQVPENTEPAETPAPTPSAEPAETSEPTPTPAPLAPPEGGYYFLPDSASRYLTEADLEGMSDRDLMLARNEIFARHGFIFTTQWIQGYFLLQGWYTPTVQANQFDSSVFNDYERANVDLIVRVEAERAG